MNFLDALGKVFGLVPKAVEAIKSLVAATRPTPKPKPKPIPFGRKHFWTFPTYSDLRAPIRPYECVYCKVTRTMQNENEQCPGPEVKR